MTRSRLKLVVAQGEVRSHKIHALRYVLFCTCCELYIIHDVLPSCKHMYIIQFTALYHTFNILF